MSYNETADKLCEAGDRYRTAYSALNDDVPLAEQAVRMVDFHDAEDNLRHWAKRYLGIDED